MRSDKKDWTLVRYAGPTSKASIGSKPIGSELKRYVEIYILQVNKKLIWSALTCLTSGCAEIFHTTPDANLSASDAALSPAIIAISPVNPGGSVSPHR